MPWTPGAPVVDAGEVGQWFGAYQRDLAARLKYSVTPDFADANHAPRIIAAELERSTSPGQRVEFAFTVEDPDGDTISVSATQHQGPPCEISISATGVVVFVPSDTPTEDDIHIIVQAVDTGLPALTGYARFILGSSNWALDHAPPPGFGTQRAKPTATRLQRMHAQLLALNTTSIATASGGGQSAILKAVPQRAGSSGSASNRAARSSER